jgi:cysteine dioxygenase
MSNSLTDLFKSFETYFESHETLENKEAHHILKNYTGNDWKSYVSFKDDYYHRVRFTDLLGSLKTDKFEIMLICWKKGQESPIHDHPKDGCLMKVLDGNLEEEVYASTESSAKLEIIKTSCLSPGLLSYIDDTKGYHKVKSHNVDSVSIHVYSPAYFICHKYE